MTQDLGKTDIPAQDLPVHGHGLPGEFHQHIGKKTASVKNLSPEIIPQSVFNGPLNPLQGIGYLAAVFKDDSLPDPGRLFINGIPAFFFAPEMTVEPPLGQMGSLQDIADGGIEILFDGEELQGLFDDLLAGLTPLGPQSFPFIKKQNGWYIFI